MSDPLFQKPVRSTTVDVRREAASAVRRIVQELLLLVPEGASSSRIRLRGLLGECNAILGEHRSRANATDVAWEAEDGVPED